MGGTGIVFRAEVGRVQRGLDVTGRWAMRYNADGIAAIRANPNCDMERLRYADWLEETDGADERLYAQFIRDSIVGCPNYRQQRGGDIQRTLAVLIQSMGLSTWGFAPLFGVANDRPEASFLAHGRSAKFLFRRGFLHVIEAMSGDDWLGYAPMLVERQPVAATAEMINYGHAEPLTVTFLSDREQPDANNPLYWVGVRIGGEVYTDYDLKEVIRSGCHTLGEVHQEPMERAFMDHRNPKWFSDVDQSSFDRAKFIDRMERTFPKDSVRSTKRFPTEYQQTWPAPTPSQ
jgi:uncharacterized protein (TIGR02996 family)